MIAGILSLCLTTDFHIMHFYFRSQPKICPRHEIVYKSIIMWLFVTKNSIFPKSGKMIRRSSTPSIIFKGIENVPILVARYIFSSGGIIKKATEQALIFISCTNICILFALSQYFHEQKHTNLYFSVSSHKYKEELLKLSGKFMWLWLFYKKVKCQQSNTKTAQTKYVFLRRRRQHALNSENCSAKKTNVMGMATTNGFTFQQLSIIFVAAFCLKFFQWFLHFKKERKKKHWTRFLLKVIHFFELTCCSTSKAISTNKSRNSWIDFSSFNNSSCLIWTSSRARLASSVSVIIWM